MGINSPTRAVRFTMLMEADTVEDLADALRHMAFQAEAGELTVGVIGGGSSGSSYELLIDQEQTHQRYFEQVRGYLAERKKGSPHEPA